MLADNIKDVIMLADAHGRRIYMSPSVEPALGYTLDELYDMPAYRFIHPDDREDLRRKIEAFPAGGGELKAEYRVVRADGEVRWIETSFTLRYSSAGCGAPPHVVSVGRDVQARKELEVELMDARLLAEAAAAAKNPTSSPTCDP